MRNRTREQVEACRSLLPEGRFEIFIGWLRENVESETRSLLASASDADLRRNQGRVQVLRELLDALDRKTLDEAIVRFSKQP